MQTQPTISPKKNKSFLKERILRFRPVVFIRKNIFLFSFLTIFFLTWILGVWDIKRYEIFDLDGNDLSEDVVIEIQEYIEKNILGENYFTFSPTQTKEQMYLDIAKIRSIRIEKVVPNKLTLFVQTYSPKYVSYLKSENCNVLSQEGIVLSEICLDLERDCCSEYSIENNLLFFESNDVEISVFDNEKDRLLIMEEIAKVVKVNEAFQYKIERISLQNDILEVVDENDIVFRFTIATDIDIQLRRFVIVMGKVKVDHMGISSLDLRFERPVLLD